MTAPVCPVSRSQPVSNQAGVFAPVMAPATDLASALQAARQLQNLLLMLGAGRPFNNLYPSAQGGSQIGIGRVQAGTGAGQGGGVAGLQKRNWVENIAKRVTRVDRIYMNDDKTSDVYADVKRLVHMEMRDTITGERLVWNYGS